MNYHLPDVLEAFEDESLPGLAMRYAALYPPLAPVDLFARLDLPAKMTLAAVLSQDPSSEAGLAVLDLLNVPPHRRARLSLWSPKVRSYRVLGTDVPVLMTDVGVRRCCPECLAEQPRHRAAWLITALPACAVHGRMLLVACPACEKPLRWSGGGVALCSNHLCGQDLRDATTAKVTEGERSAIAGLAALLSSGRHPAGWSFADVVRAVLAIGGVESADTKRFSRRKAISSRPEQLLKPLETGWKAISPWPEAFHAHLDRLMARASERGHKYGVSRAYGGLGIRLSDLSKYPWAAPVLAEMSDRLVGHPEIPVRVAYVRRHGRRADDPDRRLTMDEAAKVLGVSTTTVERLACRHGLVGMKEVEGGQHMFRRQDVAWIADLRRATALLVRKAEAARILGVSSTTLMALVAAGAMPIVPDAQRTEPGLAFRRDDVANLLCRLEESAQGTPRIDVPRPGDRVIGTGGFKDGFGLPRLVPLVLAGKLAPIAVLNGREGLGKYVFPRRLPTLEVTRRSDSSRTGEDEPRKRLQS